MENYQIFYLVFCLLIIVGGTFLRFKYQKKTYELSVEKLNLRLKTNKILLIFLFAFIIFYYLIFFFIIGNFEFRFLDLVKSPFPYAVMVIYFIILDIFLLKRAISKKVQE